jgi:tetratricopeptide (TPR) repeat protein/predicted aspartyl protease
MSWRTGPACAATPAALCALIATTAATAGQCTLKNFAEFPITMVGMRPLMTAKINDTNVQFVVDSGAFYSLMSGASAAQLKLKTSPAPMGFQVKGVHGAAAEEISIANVKRFELSGATLRDIEFLVGGSEVGQGSVGVLGQNFLHIADVEYDLGGGAIRLMRPVDCSKSNLAYWAGASTPYSIVDLESESPVNTWSTGTHIQSEFSQLAHTIGSAYVNGARIRVWFDTGSTTSMLSSKAAARVGIKPDSPGVVKGGMSYGVGREFFATYLAPVASFKIGQEEIRNTRIRIGDIELPNADMLIGTDFFLSHRIYVANSQRKLYFTYNGGPVFNLSTTTSSPAGATAGDASSSQEPAVAGTGTQTAADFGRRGAALASRQEFDQALAALNRACELAPEDPGYAYLRGRVYWQLKQPDAAKADFDRALKLKPDDLPVLVARAELSLERGDNATAGADLDAAAAIAPKEADVRFQMANAYERMDRLPAAVAQLTLWLDSHADDARVPLALNSRCWVRALADVELPLALKDCNAALKGVDKSTPAYATAADSRGLVFLRMKDYDRSIADYDASLRINPKNAWSLYGRGIAELRKQQTAAGNADVASAKAIRPQIAQDSGRWGIVP